MPDLEEMIDAWKKRMDERKKQEEEEKRKEAERLARKKGQPWGVDHGKSTP